MAGSYTVTITGANGLSQTVTAQVNTPAPLLAQATPVLAFGQYALSCAGVNDATINGMAAGGTAAYQFNWSVAGQQNASLVNVGAGTYTLTVTDAQQCTATSTAVVLDPPPFTFDLTLASVNCGASSATATIAPLNGISPFTVSVDGMIASIGLNPIVPNGNHLISISDGNGCLADTMVEVVLPPVPVITLPAEQVVTLGETLILEAQTNLSSWQSLIWTPQPDSTCVSCLRQEWVPDNSRVYQVAITDTFGCSATASVRVMVKKQFDLYIPNVFSPNLDGIHDFWQLDAGPSVVALNSMRIFDRWGDLVYFWDASIPVDEWPGWDGRTRGEDVNPGVFVYYLEVKLANGEIVEKKGDVTVVR
jgi:gliding motility-associated-like protein